MTDLVRPRPRSLRGSTYKIKTPVGTAFITINNNGDGKPFEVFINVGKGGSDVAALAEMSGRLISLLLRTAADPDAIAKEIIDQLKGIGGGRSLGFGPEKSSSLADAVAKAFEIHLGLVKDSSLEEVVVPVEKIGDLCPECGKATFIHEEGCQKCSSCGFSKC